MNEKPPSPTDRRTELLAEEQRLAAELDDVRAALRELNDTKPGNPAHNFDGTGITAPAQAWLRARGIKDRNELAHPDFTPKAFLSALPTPTTTDITIFTQVSTVCRRINAAWTENETDRVKNELMRKMTTKSHSLGA